MLSDIYSQRGQEETINRRHNNNENSRFLLVFVVKIYNDQRGRKARLFTALVFETRGIVAAALAFGSCRCVPLVSKTRAVNPRFSPLLRYIYNAKETF